MLADRATLAFLCEAYHEDKVPDENGNPRERVLLKLHPRLAPMKAAVFPLVKKDGMPEVAQKIYRDLKKRFKFVGDSGVYHFLWTVKHPVPDWREWSRAHGMDWEAKAKAAAGGRARRSGAKPRQPAKARSRARIAD